MYENRLFLLKTTSAGGKGLVSVESAQLAQQRQLDRNRFGLGGVGAEEVGELGKRNEGQAGAASAQVKTTGALFCRQVVWWGGGSVHGRVAHLYPFG